MSELYQQTTKWLCGSRWRIIAIAGVVSMILQNALNLFAEEVTRTLIDNLLVGMLSALLVIWFASPAKMCGLVMGYVRVACLFVARALKSEGNKR